MRPILTLCLGLLLSACALPQERSRTFNPYQPLDARITTTTVSGPLFRVNRPAYVAMFYIVPGSGVSMIYPGFGTGTLSGRTFAGSHFANMRLNNRDQYVFTRGSYGQPRFYFLIASDRPLNVQQFGTFGELLPTRLSSFASFSPYSTMEDLAMMALPALVDDGSWTTDFYVEWPSVIHREAAPGRVLVACGSYAVYVPRGYVSTVRSMLCDRNEPRDRRQEGDEDEDRPRVVKPGTREPVPADAGGERQDPVEREAVTAAQRRALERVTSSTQLRAPGPRDALGGRSAYGDDPSERVRPVPDRYGDSGRSSSSGSSASSGNSQPASRPAATPSSRPAPATPAASPAPRSSGGSGAVSAPTRERPSPK